MPRVQPRTRRRGRARRSCRHRSGAARAGAPHLRSDTHAGERKRRRAEILALQEALEALPGLVEDLGTDHEVADQLRAEYDRRLRILRADERDEATADGAANWEKQHADLRVALLGRKHDTLVRLRDRDEIDDNVLQQVQAALDLEWVAVDRHRRET